MPEYESTKFDILLKPAEGGVFISHLAEEKTVAGLLQETLKAAFGAELDVFVSSDKTSITSGQPWYDRITTALNRAKVVIVLLSQESCRKPWINFEAGIGIGNRASVIPLTLSRINTSQVPFPIAGMQVHSIDDIAVILRDVGQGLGKAPEKVDLDVYATDLRVAEAKLNYKAVSVRPYISDFHLRFEITNTGSADIELLMLEFEIASRAIHWPSFAGMHNLFEQDGRGETTWPGCYAPRGTLLNITPVLRPILTNTMGAFTPRFSLPLDQDRARHVPPGMPFRFQLHVANYQTEMSEMRFADLFYS